MEKKTWKRQRFVQLSPCPTPDLLWKCIQNTDLPSLLQVDEAFVAARAIHEGDAFVRDELEARVLANQSPAEIANRMRIPAEVVTEYQDYFFDVRGRFHMTGWIAHEAIRRHPSGELLAGDVGPFWRWVGFNFGPEALESFLTAVSVDVLRIQGLDAYWQRGLPINVDLKLLVLILRLPLPTTRAELVSWLEMQEELFSLQSLPVDDLLTPLRLEMHPFGEPELAVSTFEVEGRGAEDEFKVFRLLKTIFDVKQRRVEQANVA
ncbi:hypothetical protein [Schlesneria sp. T3-172]|uniref:hypothetical protein n=1 Tax=Schlesneria sphaerica TaxID=3373610 RepID=UPI0037C94F22